MAIRRTILNAFAAFSNLFSRGAVQPVERHSPAAAEPAATEPAAVPAASTAIDNTSGDQGRPEHPVRLRSSASGLLDNSGFFEQLRQARDEQAPVPTPRTQYTLPALKLPKPHKAAFTAAQLFEQQRDLARHDYGLQTVLDALHSAINQFMGRAYAGHTPIPLSEFDFTMNFSGAAAPDRKVFVANMRQPLQGTVELVQTLDESMRSTWQLVVRGQLYVYTPPAPTMDPELVRFVQPPPPPAVIQDDTADHRPGRVIDFE